MAGDWHVRPARDADAPGLITLIGGCYAEYPGCVLDLVEWEADLNAIATAFAAKGGNIWVVEGADGAILATVGATPDPAEQCGELKRLYVSPLLRGQGLAGQLVALAEQAARGWGFTTMALWTDTRFVTAHRVYARLGYAYTGRTRDLHDPSNTTEYQYIRALTP
jgi:putative acetyltransferase